MTTAPTFAICSAPTARDTLSGTSGCAGRSGAFQSSNTARVCGIGWKCSRAAVPLHHATDGDEMSTVLTNGCWLSSLPLPFSPL